MDANRNYENTIVAASNNPNLDSVLVNLAPFTDYKDIDSALDLLPRPSSYLSRKLLAGILLRAGRIERASRVLTDVSPPKLDATDALIIDPGFAQITGHHFNTNVFYKRLIEKCGLSVKVLRSALQHPSMQQEETNSIRTFAISSHENLFPAELPISGLSEMNALFSYEFQRTLPKTCPRLLVVHTARHTFIEGFCQYLNGVEFSSPARAIIGIVEPKAFANDYRWHEEICDIYSRSFALLRDLTKLKILVVVETQEMANHLKMIAGDWFATKVMPYVAGSLNEVVESPLRKNSRVPVIGFVGQTRLERGVLMIPEIAKQTLKGASKPCVWKAQLDTDELKRYSDLSLDKTLVWLENNSCFKIIGKNLSLIDYYRLLASIDIMVMPYSVRYATTGSGISIESLKFGHIQVVPEHSSMARAANARGAGMVTFTEATPVQVSAAIDKALQQYDSLRHLSLDSAKTARLESKEQLSALEDFFRSA